MNLIGERDWSFFSEIFFWEARRDAKNFRKFEKFNEVSGGEKVMAGEWGKVDINFRESIRKII